ncbi:MAG: hypothetical protein HGA45_04250 [Chloroflexales bacterium]|nr:hypothetical protein [Chloroflexales bacterium]
METLIVIGAVAIVLAMLLSATAPAPQPPRIIYVQTAVEPQPAQGQGCLGLIFGIILFAALVALIAQVAS